MELLPRQELATAAGTTPDVIDRLIGLGIIAAPGEQGFPVPDIARVRLALALEASGVPLPAVGTAIASGRLSLGFIDQLVPNPGRLLPRTQQQVTQEAGIPDSLAARVRTILGTAGLQDDDPIRADDAEMFGMVARASELGVDEERLTRIVRVVADSLRRIVETQRQFVDELLVQPALGSGMTEQEMLDAASTLRLEFRKLAARLVVLMHDRLIDEAVVQNLVEQLEATLAREGIVRLRDASSPAIAFADLSGYTRITQEAGDRVAAQHAGRFADLAQDIARSQGGKLVKLLGDGAMMHFEDAASAVRTALALVREAPLRELPAARVGVDAGPVVQQDGDYFGTTVNVASRTSDYARPGEVLVTKGVVTAWPGGGHVLFHEIGPVPLKNVAEPVELFQAIPAGEPGRPS